MNLYVLIAIAFVLYYLTLSYFHFRKRGKEQQVVIEGIGFKNDEIISVKKDMIIKIVSDEKEDTKILYDFVCKISDLNSGKLNVKNELAAETAAEEEIDILMKEDIDFERYEHF